MFRKLIYLFNKSLYSRLYEERCQEILKNLTSLFTNEQPYVKNGFWSWFVVDKVESIPIVYPEIPLLVEIEKYQIGTWKDVGKYCKNKIEWMYFNKVHSGLINTSRELEIPLLLIKIDDPIDKETLKSKVLKLLGSE